MDYEKRLQRVIDHIYDTPNGDLSLDALADVAAMSRFHWHRVFRAMTGETCAGAVRRIRMHRASVALVQSDAPIADIAASVGYPNVPSFSRAFAEIYRISPGAFRDAGRAMPRPVHIRPGETKMYDIEIREMPARTLAAVRHQGAYPEIGRSFQSLYATIGARGYFDKIGHGVAAYFDDVASKPATELRSVAGVTLNLGVKAPEGLETFAIDGGEAAVLTLRGPYSGLGHAWDHLYRAFLPKEGREMADQPPYEIYLTDPTSAAPDDLVTEIVVPLK